MGHMGRGARIALATLVAGTLDIAAAMGLTLLYHREIARMLRYVASGPFPEATEWSTAGAVAGLVVHYAIMAVMAATFVFAADRVDLLKRRWLAAGIGYGLLTYVVMNLIVVPLRFPGSFPPGAVALATQLFCHIALVGVPIAAIARR